jgi:hypothetical protein
VKPIGAVLIDLLKDLPLETGEQADGIRVTVNTIDLQLPIETRLTGAATLLASPPRGVLATAFDPPLGCLKVRFRRVDP